MWNRATSALRGMYPTAATLHRDRQEGPCKTARTLCGSDAAFRQTLRGTNENLAKSPLFSLASLAGEILLTVLTFRTVCFIVTVNNCI